MANELEERRKGSTTCVVNDMTQLLAFQKLRSMSDPSKSRIHDVNESVESSRMAGAMRNWRKRGDRVCERGKQERERTREKGFGVRT